MSILNRPTDGSAPVLLVLWRALRRLGPMPKEKLLALCAPPSIGDDQAKKTLLRWAQLRLFVEQDDGLRLAPPFDRLDADGSPDYGAFRREVRRLTLSEESNQEFLKPEPGGAADFTFVAAWLLSTDVYADHFHSHPHIQRLEQSQVAPIGAGDSKYALQNDTRWVGFRDWAAFLGFAWNSTPFQLDPTEAIEDELDDVFGEETELAADDFVQRLGDKLPVLDGGEYCHRARERATDGWRPIKDREVSPALSRALLRLKESGRIRLDLRSDADSRQLLGAAFVDTRRVSHIELRSENDERS